MRRFVLPFLVLVTAVCATAALAAPERPARQSARFALQINVSGPNGAFAMAGTGTIDGTRRLSNYDFTANGRRFSAVIGTSPQLTVFLKGETLQQQLPNGMTWAREDGGTAGPLIDPGVALRLDGGLGHAVGKAQVGGAMMTKYAIRILLPDAALLAPTQSTKSLLKGLPAVVWIDGAGNVRRLQAVASFGTSRVRIDEQLSDFGSPVSVTRPSDDTVSDHRFLNAKQLLGSLLLALEPYNGDNSGWVGAGADPNPRLTGYAGATVAYLRRHYDHKLGNVKIVRATALTYCIQATVNGVTAKKDGPDAAMAEGTC